MAFKLWAHCTACGDTYCNYHDEHLSSCDCPNINILTGAGINPYDVSVTPKIAKYLADHTFKDDTE